MALVVELDRQTQLGAGVRKTANAPSLVALLAPERQRESDDQRSNGLILARRSDRGDVHREAPARDRAERADQPVRIIADRQSDPAIADIERKIPHRSGRS